MQQTNSIFKLPILVNISFIIMSLIMRAFYNSLGLMDIIKYLSNPYTILNNLIIFTICCLFFNKYKRYTLNFLNIVTALIIGVVCGLLLRLIGHTKVQFLIKGMESGDYEVMSNTYFIYSILGFIPTIIVIILLCLIVLPITQAGIGRNINAMVNNAVAKNRFLYFLFTITIYFCISDLTINFISQFASGYGDFSRTEYLYFSMIGNVVCGLIILAVTYSQFPSRLTKVYSGKIVSCVLLSFLLQLVINIILAMLIFFLFINSFMYSSYYGVDPVVLIAALAIVVITFIMALLINYMMTKHLFSRLEPQSNQASEQAPQTAQLIS